jgi:hypothetical protein
MQELPRPKNRSERWVLQALVETKDELQGEIVLDRAKELAERAGDDFDRTLGSTYLLALNEDDFVDSEVSARYLGARLYRLRDEHRPET